MKQEAKGSARTAASISYLTLPGLGNELRIGEEWDFFHCCAQVLLQP